MPRCVLQRWPHVLDTPSAQAEAHSRSLCKNGALRLTHRRKRLTRDPQRPMCHSGKPAGRAEQAVHACRPAVHGPRWLTHQAQGATLGMFRAGRRALCPANRLNNRLGGVNKPRYSQGHTNTHNWERAWGLIWLGQWAAGRLGGDWLLGRTKQRDFAVHAGKAQGNQPLATLTPNWVDVLGKHQAMRPVGLIAVREGLHKSPGHVLGASVIA